MWKKIKDFIVVAIGVISGILTIISFIWLVLDVKIEKLNLVIDLNFFFVNINEYSAVVRPPIQTSGTASP